MLAGTALYVCFMVYMGLSLFIIRQALRIYGCMRIYVYNLTLDQEATHPLVMGQKWTQPGTGGNQQVE